MREWFLCAAVYNYEELSLQDLTIIPAQAFHLGIFLKPFV